MKFCYWSVEEEGCLPAQIIIASVVWPLRMFFIWNSRRQQHYNHATWRHCLLDLYRLYTVVYFIVFFLLFLYSQSPRHSSCLNLTVKFCNHCVWKRCSVDSKCSKHCHWMVSCNNHLDYYCCFFTWKQSWHYISFFFWFLSTHCYSHRVHHVCVCDLTLEH